jgi:hypothetical protein
MFKSNHLAGVLNFRNGGSVPSIGGVTLAGALARVEAAEQALSAARSAARAAAKAEGKSVRHLFDGHPYVARSSAERWVDEARQEGWRAGATFLADAQAFLRDPDPPDSPFFHLATRLKRNGLPPLVEVVAAVNGNTATGAAIVAAGKLARMGGPELPPPPKGSFAAQVVAAAAKARRPMGDE